jgi:glutamate dehydrogenase (NADP+)
MPSSDEAVQLYFKHNVIFCPGKAANAGGVACSALEMAQNSMRMPWDRERVDQELQKVMKDLYQECKNSAAKYGSPGNLLMGANIAGFLRVADSMIEQGCV